jgi:hypothetical protein
MSDAPRYGLEEVAKHEGELKRKKGDPKPKTAVLGLDFPGTLKQATKKAALGAIEKKEAKKKPQGETTAVETE